MGCLAGADAAAVSAAEALPTVAEEALKGVHGVFHWREGGVSRVGGQT